MERDPAGYASARFLARALTDGGRRSPCFAKPTAPTTDWRYWRKRSTTPGARIPARAGWLPVGPATQQVLAQRLDDDTPARLVHFFVLPGDHRHGCLALRNGYARFQTCACIKAVPMATILPQLHQRKGNEGHIGPLEKSHARR